MSRINTPATIANASEASDDLRKGFEKMLGSASNMFRPVGNSPAKLSDVEIEADRDGRSTDAKADAAIGTAVKVERDLGWITRRLITEVRNTGYNDAKLVEIVGHVALNVPTNSTKEVFETEVDLSVYEAARAA